MVNLRSRVTRLGVLDIGSNTIHMLIVDAAPGARPDPEASTKSTVRLMQYAKDDGSIKKSGIEAILTAVDQCMELAEEYDITQLLAMATSAIKEAPNSNKILRKIEERIGQRCDRAVGNGRGPPDVPRRPTRSPNPSIRRMPWARQRRSAHWHVWRARCCASPGARTRGS